MDTRRDLSLETYAEPFAASGRYFDYGELAAPRSRSLLPYGLYGTTIDRQADGTRVIAADGQIFVLANADFNVRSFRSNVLLRWEWKPGSTMFVVWQQDRSESAADGRLVGPGGLADAMRAPGNDFLAVKFTYWLGLR